MKLVTTRSGIKVYADIYSINSCESPTNWRFVLSDEHEASERYVYCAGEHAEHLLELVILYLVAAETPGRRLCSLATDTFYTLGYRAGTTVEPLYAVAVGSEEEGINVGRDAIRVYNEVLLALQVLVGQRKDGCECDECED